MTDKKDKSKPKPRKVPDSVKTLTVKQQLFVYERMVANKSKKAAVEAAYNPTTDDSANAMVQALNKHPGVQQAMTDVLMQKYPDINEDMSDLVKHGLNLWREDDDPKTLALCKEFLELAAKMKGDFAPIKSQRLNANIFKKLPGSDDND